MNNFSVSIRKSKSLPIIIIYYNGKRHRYWNGKAIGIKLKCIDNPSLLKSAFELKLREGWKPKLKKKECKDKPITVVQALYNGLETKVSQRCSERYLEDIKRIILLWKRYESKQYIKNITIDKLKPSHVTKFLVRPNWSAKTQRTVKSTISPLLIEYKPNLFQSIKLKKPTSTLHKPIEKINDLLLEIKAFNERLHLCCLLTYGCLLRPHREIRELTWGDFSLELNFINLSGNRNKSGRNRIVPVPTYIRELLIKGEPHHNIFSGKPQPLNKDYFKTLWGPKPLKVRTY